MDGNSVMIQRYLDTLPRDDLSTLIYWDPDTLNQVDSQIIRKSHMETCTFYKQIYGMLVNNPDSPYIKYSAGDNLP